MTGPQAICPSCGAAATGPYCGRCGQSLSWAAPPVPTAEREHRVATFVGFGVVGILIVAAIGLGYRVVTRDNAPSPTPPAAAAGVGSSSSTSIPPTGDPASSSPTSTSAQTATETVTVTPSESTSATTTEPDPAAANDQALDTLRAARADSLTTLSLDGRWVLQLSSKANGMSDPLQYASDGGHVFYYPDIVAEHTRIQALLTEHGWPWITLLASDFGKNQSAADAKIWVLLGDPGGLTSSDDAQAYCQALYPDRSGDALKNVCMPRRMDPPS